MKDEIKEKIKAYYVANDIDEILDYITNLQEEVEDLSRMCELYSKSLYCAELTDYKSRIEKANDCILNILSKQKFRYYDTKTKMMYLKKVDIKDINELINILQGVGKDE